MDTLEDRRHDFESRLDAITRRYRDDRLGRSNDDSAIEARLKAYQARLDALTREHERRTQAMLDRIWREHSPLPRPSAHPTYPGPPLVEARVGLNDVPALKALDAAFVREFQLDHYFPHSTWQNLPTVYCETLEEFYRPFVDMLDVSEATRQEMLRSYEKKAVEDARAGKGIWGIFWPSRGCYINGWLFAYGRVKDARAALADPTIFPSILSTTAHEKLGHGFVSEYTALGQEKKRLGTWRYDIARRFDVRGVDTPTGELLAAKEAVLYASSQLLEEGWATWIEHHVMQQLARQAAAEGRPFPPVSEARYTVNGLWHVLTQILDGAKDAETRERVQALLDAISVLLITRNVRSEDLHRAVLSIHAHAEHVDPLVVSRLGQPLRYVIGYLLARDLAARLGPLCLPYAVILAANVSYDLEKIALSDLQRLVAQDMRLNVDSRFAHMRLITLQSENDVRELVMRVHQELNLAIPKALHM